MGGRWKSKLSRRMLPKRMWVNPHTNLYHWAPECNTLLSSQGRARLLQQLSPIITTFHLLLVLGRKQVPEAPNTDGQSSQCFWLDKKLFGARMLHYDNCIMILVQSPELQAWALDSLCPDRQQHHSSHWDLCQSMPTDHLVKSQQMVSCQGSGVTSNAASCCPRNTV